LFFDSTLGDNMKLIASIILHFVLSMSLYAQYIGISEVDFTPHHRAQKTPMWCWASCAEMVLSYEEIYLPQDAIVTLIKGAPIVAGGNPYEMINSTNGILKDREGKRVVISGQFVFSAPQSTVLFNQLKHHRPVILTYSTGPWSGHAVVLIGADYSLVGSGALMISRIYVCDPFIYVLTKDIFGNPFFKEDSTLKFKKYNLQMSPMGLQMKDGFNTVGIITGTILVDASPL
jgi:hypothetical protein